MTRLRDLSYVDDPVTYLRSCGQCAAHIVTSDNLSYTVFCPKCTAKRPSFEQWAARIGVGSRVYVQPQIVGRLHSRTVYVVLERDGERVRLQALGWPDLVVQTTIGQLANEPIASGEAVRAQ